ncbi:low affinity iron permease family protein [Acidovorax sp.]|uniref:low affinity iron permease family protein n=1 Tax=Acidovorax sp. TaxID=1872122 RepID=UPI00391FAEF0
MNEQAHVLDKDGTDALGSMPTTTSPSYADRSALQTGFDHFASKVTRWAGSPGIFCGALAVVLIWALAGPIFHFSENWQLVINTGTTIVTFLMVFLIQQSQNKDSVAIHLKLNELLAANREASNRMIGIEELDEQDLRDVANFYVRLAGRAKAMGGQKEAHSIDEEGMPVTRMEAQRHRSQ